MKKINIDGVDYVIGITRPGVGQYGYWRNQIWLVSGIAGKINSMVVTLERKSTHQSLNLNISEYRNLKRIWIPGKFDGKINL